MKLPPPAEPGGVNHDAFDRFTWAHLGVGVLYGALGARFEVAAGLAVLWEVAENPMKAAWPRLFPNATRDRWRNSAVDVAAVLGGWWLFRWIAKAAHNYL